jgi:hypothetical protein
MPASIAFDILFRGIPGSKRSLASDAHTKQNKAGGKNPENVVKDEHVSPL